MSTDVNNGLIPMSAGQRSQHPGQRFSLHVTSHQRCLQAVQSGKPYGRSKSRSCKSNHRTQVWLSVWPQGVQPHKSRWPAMRSLSTAWLGSGHSPHSVAGGEQLERPPRPPAPPRCVAPPAFFQKGQFFRVEMYLAVRNVSLLGSFSQALALLWF